MGSEVNPLSPANFISIQTHGIFFPIVQIIYLTPDLENITALRALMSNKLLSAEPAVHA